MTELEQAEAVEDALADEWRCAGCRTRYSVGSRWARTSGPGWGPWCGACWTAWSKREDYDPKISLDRERARFQRKMRARGTIRA